MVEVFKYIDDLDCFIINSDYKKITDLLGLTEWNEAVWLGRYFLLDNDFGEHWFDNWELREQIEEKAKGLGFSSDELLVIDPERFKNNVDGPCHTDFERKRFWTDVLKSLKLSYETIFDEARKVNTLRDKQDEDYLADLEKRIESLKAPFR